MFFGSLVAMQDGSNSQDADSSSISSQDSDSVKCHIDSAVDIFSYLHFADKIERKVTKAYSCITAACALVIEEGKKNPDELKEMLFLLKNYLETRLEGDIEEIKKYMNNNSKTLECSDKLKEILESTVALIEDNLHQIRFAGVMPGKALEKSSSAP